MDLQAALSRIRVWGEARDWQGYDPYDALNSALTPVLMGIPLARRLLTQTVKLSPINLRPLLRIKPAWNAKAIALIASGYTKLAFATGEGGARGSAERWLDWLVERHAPDGMAWGYHFDVQTRFFSYPSGTPNTIATSFGAQALLDGCEFLGQTRWGEPARKAAAYLVERMLVERRATPFFQYVPGDDTFIHNANMLACAVLARVARVTGEASFLDPARAALQTSLRAQRSDGAWPYAEQAGQRWVDNFHSAYVLGALAECEHLSPEGPPALERGLAYWDRELFLDDGTPKYFPDRLFPIDAHCYATAIATWVAASGRHPHALERAQRLARLLIDRMLDPTGYVHFQRRRFWTSRVPLVRWTTAPTFEALAALLLALTKARAVT